MTGALAVLLASLTAQQLLDRCIAYHDPEDRWRTGAFEIVDRSTRPDGKGRLTRLRFDNAARTLRDVRLRRGPARSRSSSTMTR